MSTSWTTIDYAYAAMIGQAHHQEPSHYLVAMGPGAPVGKCAEEILEDAAEDVKELCLMRKQVVDRYRGIDTDFTPPPDPSGFEVKGAPRRANRGPNSRTIKPETVVELAERHFKTLDVITSAAFKHVSRYPYKVPSGPTIRARIGLTPLDLCVVLGYHDKVPETTWEAAGRGKPNEYNLAKWRSQSAETLQRRGLAHLVPGT